MKRLIYLPLILVGILAALHLLLTGSPIPLLIIDSLHSPRSVVAIEDTSLKTSDGGQIDLPHAARIRGHPFLAEDLLKHGTEVSSTGEIYGLIRIHHWCGNDPVRFHLARVNLLSLAAFLEYNPKGLSPNRRIDPGMLSFLRLPPERIKEVFAERRN